MLADRLRRDEDGVTLLEILVFVLIGTIFVVIMIATLFANVEEQPDSEEESTTVDAVVPAAESASTEFSWDLLLVPGLILVGIAALMGIGYGGYRTYLSIQHRRKQQANLEGRLEEVKILHKSLLDKWANYELDLEMAIRYPLVTDVSNPLTSTMLHSLREADLARPRSATRTEVDSYAASVSKFEKELNTLLSEAKRLAWSGFETAERRRLETALRLLKITKDEAASPHERQIAYKRVISELEGIVVLPEAPLAMLEQSVMKQITSTGVAA